MLLKSISSDRLLFDAQSAAIPSICRFFPFLSLSDEPASTSPSRMALSLATHGGYSTATTRRLSPAITIEGRHSPLPITLSKCYTDPTTHKSPVTDKHRINSPVTSVAAPTTPTTASGFPLMNSIESCEGVADLFLQLYTAYTEGQHILKVSSVSPEQFSLIRHIIARLPRQFRKPCFSYFGTDGLLVIKWSTQLHEKPLRTVDEMLTKQGIHLPYPSELVSGQINHNTALVTKEDTIITDVLLEFGVSDGLLEPIYPVVCQIAVTQTFQDAQEEIEILTNAYPSLCMAIIIDIQESPSFRSPLLRSVAWKTLSQESYMSYITFLNRSSIHQVPLATSSKPVIVSDHAWSSVKEVEYHVWVKVPGSNRLHVDAEPGDNYATCSSPGNSGRDIIEAMLLRGLSKVKRSVTSLCETIIRTAEHPSIDLMALHSHTTELPVSLQSFDNDIATGIQLTSHGRYQDWFNKLSRGLKCARDAKVVPTVGDGSKKARQM
ncbi:hypothetical protein JVT61DRAFT_10704 [Boletus reticuloceps]|uniref:Uncharacterized protein n=1 Tax=Boletus reticuloceps TaxID=495285 RepID=A0A8I2YF94_9AGAM|nr:hypothetical protein JVT61DRAFT_10704 [Boletus reticuloceps]